MAYWVHLLQIQDYAALHKNRTIERKLCSIWQSQALLMLEVKNVKRNNHRSLFEHFQVYHPTFQGNSFLTGFPGSQNSWSPNIHQLCLRGLWTLSSRSWVRYPKSQGLVAVTLHQNWSWNFVTILITQLYEAICRDEDFPCPIYLFGMCDWEISEISFFPTFSYISWLWLRLIGLKENLLICWLPESFCGFHWFHCCVPLSPSKARQMKLPSSTFADTKLLSLLSLDRIPFAFSHCFGLQKLLPRILVSCAWIAGCDPGTTMPWLLLLGSKTFININETHVMSNLKCLFFGCSWKSILSENIQWSNEMIFLLHPTRIPGFFERGQVWQGFEHH